MFLRLLPCVLAGLCLLPPAAAVAQRDAKPLEFTADLGLVHTSGNSSVTTLNAGEQLRVRGGSVVFSQFFKVVYGKSEGDVTTSNWNAGGRADVDLSEIVSVFALVAWDRNTFAGIARRFEEAAGLAVRAIGTPAVRLEFEGGLSLIQQRSVEAQRNNNFAAGRAAGLFRRTFSRRSWVQQTVEFFPNLKTSDDFRLNTESTLVAPLSDHVALKASYVVRFDNLPEPGFRRTDRLLTTGVQVTF